MKSCTAGIRRLLSAFVALVMVLCLLPSTALAAAPTKVYVGDTCVSDGGGGYWVVDTSDEPNSFLTQTGAGSTNYVVYYELEGGVGTLTLNNVTVPAGKCHKETNEEVDGDIGQPFHAAIYADGDLTINLIGDNNVTGPDINEGYYYTCGVCVRGDLTVSGDGTLTTTGGNKNAQELVNTPLHSYGVYVKKGITVSGGTLTGMGGKSNIFSSESCGVFAKESINVSGGTLAATGSDTTVNGSKSYGVYANFSIDVSGGTLTGTSGSTSGMLSNSCGVNAENGSITVSGGTLTGECGNATGEESYSHGVYAYLAITLTGGVTTAKGNNGAVNMQPNFSDDTQMNANWYQWKENTAAATEPTGGYAVSSDTSQFTYNDTAPAKYLKVTPPTYAVTLNLTLDGSAYTGQTITIQKGSETPYTLTEGTGGAYTNSDVPNGTYTICRNSVSTGKAVTVNNASGSATLDFFTVSFNANGGTPAPTNQVVIKDGHASEPAAMTKGTDTFGGWYSDSALTSAWTFASSKVTAATTLYAKWTPVFVPVTGLSFDGTPSVATNTNLALAATVTPNNATNRTIDWSVSASDAGTTGATVTGSVFRATAAGTAKVTATIADGTAVGTPYTQEFEITVTDTPPQPIVTPTFSPAAGTYTAAQNVALSCATDGATIRYTIDGTDPTESSTAYSSAIPVSATTTIKAKAFKTGMTPSAIASATYTINIAPIVVPATVSPASTFVQGSAPELVVTFTAGVPNFNATNNFGGIDATSQLKPDVGTITTPGTDGKVEDGSIKLTLYQSYLNALAPGTYLLRIRLTGNPALMPTAQTYITVTAPGAGGDAEADVPKTGDNSMPGLWIGIMMLAGAGLITFRKRRRA